MDEGRWLRRDARLYWTRVGLAVATINLLPWGMFGLDLLGGRPNSSWGLMLATGLFGLFFPLVSGAMVWLNWVGLRSDAWCVGPQGIEVWEEGTLAHAYSWTMIREIDPWTTDSVRIVLLDNSKEEKLDFQTPEVVLWFREYARGRVAKPLAPTADWL